MKKFFQALGCLLLAVACWLVGTKAGRGDPRKVEDDGKKPNHESPSSAGSTGSEGSNPRSAPPRPELKNRPILLGKKVTVLGGAITETGSEGPVKFQNRDGMIFSVSALRAGEGDEVLLVAPLEVTGETLSGTIRKKVGVVTLTKDGQLKAEGDVEFEAAEPGHGVQQQQE